MLKSFSSFPDNPTLQNIVNGKIADKKVNVDKCIQFGQEIINKYAGHPFSPMNVLRNVLRMFNLTVSQPR